MRIPIFIGNNDAFLIPVISENAFYIETSAEMLLTDGYSLGDDGGCRKKASFGEVVSLLPQIGLYLGCSLDVTSSSDPVGDDFLFDCDYPMQYYTSYELTVDSAMIFHGDTLSDGSLLGIRKSLVEALVKFVYFSLISRENIGCGKKSFDDVVLACDSDERDISLSELATLVISSFDEPGAFYHTNLVWRVKHSPFGYALIAPNRENSEYVVTFCEDFSTFCKSAFNILTGCHIAWSDMELSESVLSAVRKKFGPSIGLTFENFFESDNGIALYFVGKSKEDAGYFYFNSSGILERMCQ